MKILLVNQFFWPDSAATSQLLTDLAHELAARGHDVTAVCGTGVYAADEQRSDSPAVKIVRTPAIRFHRGGLGRILSYTSFLGTAFWAGLVSSKPDVILTLTTPPLLSLAGTIIRYLRGVRPWIWDMDVYPDVAVALGYLPAQGLAERVIGALADFSRRRADGILVLGECMRDRLVAHGISHDRLHVAHNWADSRKIKPVQFSKTPMLKILYSGNLGLAHDVETIREAMLALRNEPIIQFDFAGGGSRREELEAWTIEQGIRNVEFRPYCSRKDLGESLGRGDLGLVTQRVDCLGSVVPSKVYGLMAAARPILFIGPKEAQPGRIIQQFQCGWQIDCGDSAGLVDLLRSLDADRDRLSEAGLRGRRALLDYFDLPRGVRRIADLLEGKPVAADVPARVPEVFQKF